MTQKPNTKARPVLVRCAVYTRKSTEEGLNQEFNSLDAQREAGEAYIASQQHEGWGCLTDRYDDGGFTGGNLERPAMKRLMSDIQAGKIDCVVVYKVDRLSRSLLDFARIMEVFDKQKVAFVSTLIACEQTNRKAFLMELDPPYCDVIVQRWEKFTGRKAERVTTAEAVA